MWLPSFIDKPLIINGGSSDSVYRSLFLFLGINGYGSIILRNYAKWNLNTKQMKRKPRSRFKFTDPSV